MGDPVAAVADVSTQEAQAALELIDVEYELELAAIIGKQGKDITKAGVMSNIFGYTIWNDMSARDVQTRELPVNMGPGKAKDRDSSNVSGPCIVTADEFDVNNARMIVRINGEVWGEDSSAHMHHTFADMIAYASQAQTLYPGESLAQVRGKIAG